MTWATPGWRWRRRRRTTAAALLRGRAARVSSRAAPPVASKRGRVVWWWCGACSRPRVAFIAVERHGGKRMVRGVRWWRGQSSCGTGTSWAATCGRETARSRVWRVQGVVWRARWRSGGSGSRWSAGVALVRARMQGVRRLVGRQCNGACGQGEGPGAKGSTWGASREQGAAPGHAGRWVWCWFGEWPGWWPCPWRGCLGLGFRAWGC